MFIPHDSYLYYTERGSQCLDSGRLNQAIVLLNSGMKNLQRGTRQYAIATAILAEAYLQKGDSSRSMATLICSAISDIEAVVMENNSIRQLAKHMFELNQIDRANRYVKESIKDANTYKARVRNIQAAKMLPIIDMAYSKEREQQRARLTHLLAIISSLTIGLIIAILLVFMQLRKLAMARKALQHSNSAQQELIQQLNQMNQTVKNQNEELSQANNIKEEYIGRFLGQCSNYIDKLDQFRRSLNKLLLANKIEETTKLVKSSQLVEEEIKVFYQNFDDAFLRIYPDFVTEFNKLLQPDFQIILKKPNMHTTELRIFALIRLGFNDSTKIASMLRHSITTIYTYRSKTKAHAIDAEHFEENVLIIGSIN